MSSTYNSIHEGEFPGVLRVAGQWRVPAVDVDVEMPAVPIKPSYALSEVARRWRVSAQTVRNELARGRLTPFVRRGLQRVSAQELERYEREARQQAQELLDQ